MDNSLRHFINSVPYSLPQKSVQRIISLYGPLYERYREVKEHTRIRLTSSSVCVKNKTNKNVFDAYHPKIGRVQCTVYSSGDICIDIDKVLLRVFVVANLFERKFSDVLKIMLHCSGEKKTLNMLNISSKKSMNSGYTILPWKSLLGDIFIYRIEEMKKVIIHETMHALRVDISDELKIDTPVCVSPDAVLNEGWVEAWTSLLNILLLHCEKKRRASKSQLENIIQREYRWYMYQAAKLMYVHGIHSFEQLFEKQCSNMMVEETNGFSYYILKACLFHRISTLIQIQLNGIRFKNLDIPKI